LNPTRKKQKERWTTMGGNQGTFEGRISSFHLPL
jgi:hypothetical protein